MVTIEQLHQMLMIAEKETLSAAAEALHISQPALSRSVQRLEGELSAELFKRSKNRIELNETGMLVVERAEHILKEVQELERAVWEKEQSKKRILTGACAPAPVWVLMPLLLKHFPYMTLSSEVRMPEEILDGLQKGNYQVAVLQSAVEDEEYVCTPLCRECLYLSVPPAHPLALKKGIYLSDLNGETMLLMTNLGIWSAVVREKMPNTKFLMQNEMDTFLTLAGASALPVFSTDLAIKFGRKVENRVNVPILDKEAKATFYCVISKKDKVKYKNVIEEIKTSFLAY